MVEASLGCCTVSVPWVKMWFCSDKYRGTWGALFFILRKKMLSCLLITLCDIFPSVLILWYCLCNFKNNCSVRKKVFREYFCCCSLRGGDRRMSSKPAFATLQFWGQPGLPKTLSQNKQSNKQANPGRNISRLIELICEPELRSIILDSTCACAQAYVCARSSRGDHS